MKTDFDIVIIGSGAGGAPIAREMALAGKTVLVLEKGPLIAPQYQTKNGRSSFKRDELLSDGSEKKLTLVGLSNTNDTFYTSHVEPDLNDEPHIYRNADGSDRATIEGYTAQVVGGGTQLYGGVSLRFTPTDLQLQTFNAGRTGLPGDPNGDVEREARDWPVTYDELEPYYCKTEKLIGLNGEWQNQQKPFSQTDTYQPPLTPNPISQFAFNGMQALAKQLNPSNPIQPYRTPLAVITRDHAPSGRKIADPESAKTSYVNRYGDPLGYKSSTWVTLLSPLIGLPNFEIRCNCVVTHLRTNGAKVDRVSYLNPAGIERTVTGKIVVVACSAIESVRLLQLSATLDANFDQRINQNDLLGKYFLTHCFGGASALMPGRYDKSRSLDADWATDCCGVKSFLDDRKLWAGAAVYNNTSDQALPLSLLRTHFAMDLDTLWNGFVMDTSLRAQGLIDFFDEQFGRGLSVSFMGNQIPQKANRIELHPRITDKWNRPVAHIIKNWHPHDGYLMDTMAQQCGDVLRLGAGNLAGFKFLGQGSVKDAPLRIANHILGGARFGADPNDSVLDKNCRAWNFDNLYVTDGAFMPTSGGANPTNTIEANSFRVADHIKGLINITMDTRFDEIFNKPENQIFQIVFFPDRIYHAQFLNATESQRYRYNVTEVRNKLDIAILKGEVYLDGNLFTNFVRVEYRASRLIELVRERGRWLQDRLSAYLKLVTASGASAETQVKLHYCPWIRAYQVEIWGTLELPAGMSHDNKVLALMGINGQITRRKNFTAVLQDIDAIATVTTAIREDDIDEPLGYKINDPAWDNNNRRTIQVPKTQDPSADQNTVELNNYELDFRRGWYLDARKTDPVRYRNGMVDYTNPNNPDKSDNNIIEMRWLLQQELGSALVYFHEVTIPPGCIEGTHRHIGSEELYFIYEGEGVAHMGEGDDPIVSTGTAFPLKQVDVYGLGKLPVREVPVKPGTIIYTKSGGIHGIRNPGTTPLRFVAFGYHTV